MDSNSDSFDRGERGSEPFRSFESFPNHPSETNLELKLCIFNAKYPLNGGAESINWPGGKKAFILGCKKVREDNRKVMM